MNLPSVRELDAMQVSSRREVAAELFGSFLDSSHKAVRGACDSYHDLVLEVGRSSADALGSLADEVRLIDAHGFFRMDAGATLLTQIPRVAGFVSAIERADDPESVIDIGSGPGALLGLAAAVLHDAQVTAVEINPRSVAVAERTVELMGYAEQVRILTGNAMGDEVQRALPAEVDLLVTETFGPAMMYEPGHEILDSLHGRAATILPASADVYAHPTVEYYRSAEAVVFNDALVGEIDFRNFDGIVSGSFEYNDQERSGIGVSVLFKDEHGDVIVPHYGDKITDSVSFPERAASNGSLSFAYEAGIVDAEYIDTIDADVRIDLSTPRGA